MNIIRLFSLVAIFGLLYLTTTGKIKMKFLFQAINFCFVVVYGNEDKIDSDVEIDEEESVLSSDETVTPANDSLVRK